MTGATDNKPLSGITIVDLTRVLAGPYCTMLLADLGARVIKVEDPNGGDDSRHICPFVDGESVYFASINRNKESIAINLKDERGRAEFEQLLSKADILIENFRPGVMARLGYGWNDVHARYPRLIYASISGFGQTGPLKSRPAYDMVVQAMGGLMSVTGEPDGLPVRVGVSVGDISAGLYATIGVQAALLKRARCGQGERLDISMLDCQVALMENPIARYSATGDLPRPLGTRHSSITPFDLFKTADGFITLAVGNDSLFKKLCFALGHPEWAEDERFALLDARNRNHLLLKEYLEECLKSGTKRAWADTFHSHGIPHGTLNGVNDLFDSEQVKARKMIVPMSIGKAGEIKVASNPVKLDSVAHSSKLGKAPMLDEHRESILHELGMPVIEIRQP
jgi:CoA:oxalate CoA-transferase